MKRQKPSPIYLLFQGIKFKLNIKPETGYQSGEPIIYINRVSAAKMIRQYIKEKYPKQFKSWVKSESYSGGSSIDVSLCNFDGSPVESKIYDDVRSFSMLLKAGHFNGMFDSYEYKDNLKSDNGTEISMITSYIHIDNEPPYGTKEFELNRNKK